MTYIEAITTAVTVFPIIAFIITIPFILHQYHKYGSINKFRVLIIYSFILYLISIYFLVILPLPSIEQVSNMTGKTTQLIPFSFINDIINNTSFKINDLSSYIPTITAPVVYTMLFNVLMTIPFGMYLRYYYKFNLKKVFFFSFLLSLFFELTQLSGLYGIYPRAYRLFDVDDLITNTLGGVIGYFIMGIVDNFLPTRDKIDEDSIEDAKIVSGFRRLTIFIFDNFIYLFIATILTLFTNFKHTFLIIFIIYYVIIPTIFNGKTIMSGFLNVRLSFPKFKIIKLFLRTLFIYLYYFIIPINILLILIFITNKINITSTISLIIYLVYIAFLIIFYISNIIILLKNKTMFYDKLFKVEYINTIKKEIEE